MDDAGGLPWTADQWATIQRTALESARRARVMSTFLPLVGPLPEGQASIPALTLSDTGVAGTAKQRLEVDDSITVPFATLSCEVYVRTQQAHDPDLSSVLQMISRAAVVIARLEDAVILVGRPATDEPPRHHARRGPFVSGDKLVVLPEIYRVSGREKSVGLRDVPDVPRPVQYPDAESYGEVLVNEVVAAVNELEGRGQYGPFGAVLGAELYEAAHRPSKGSLVLPADRIVPFLGGGPLLRASVLPPAEGVVVATAGAPIDLVVASDIHVSYLQRTLEPRYVLRVSERIVLRVKQAGAVAFLEGVKVDAPASTAP